MRSRCSSSFGSLQCGPADCLIAGNHRRRIGGREWCQGRLDPRPFLMAVNMRQESFYSRNELLSLEQLSDCNGTIERCGIAAVEGACA